MNENDAYEQAFQNGYSAGYAAGRRSVGEIVRCKDCVKRETVLCPLETYDDFPWRACREDDFCSYGEKSPQITEQTKDALMKMGENAHGER